MRTKTRVCPEPGCPHILMASGACPNPECPHNVKRRRPDTRPHRAERGHGRAFYRIRDRKIRRGETCVDCGTKGTPDNPLTGDYVTPYSRGGKCVDSNIAIRCRSCNSRKGAKTA